MEAILLAAGQGQSMNAEIPKQFFRIHGKPLFVHSLEIFNMFNNIDQIYLTCNKEYFKDYTFYIEKYNIKKTTCVEGGTTRQESVYKALSYVKSSHVLIHEAARPLISMDFLQEIFDCDDESDAIVPTVPVKFSVAIGSVYMEAELDRASLHNIQLPQLFRTDALIDAHKKAKRDLYFATEDGMLVFHYGGRVRFIKGRESNIKITTKLDIEMVERLLIME